MKSSGLHELAAANDGEGLRGATKGQRSSGTQAHREVGMLAASLGEGDEMIQEVRIDVNATDSLLNCEYVRGIKNWLKAL